MVAALLGAWPAPLPPSDEGDYQGGSGMVPPSIVRMVPLM